jgi:hypothetical protein
MIGNHKRYYSELFLSGDKVKNEEEEEEKTIHRPSSGRRIGSSSVMRSALAKREVFFICVGGV